MNKHCYKTIFSEHLGALVAVGEHASSSCKGQGASTGTGLTGSLDLRFVGVLALGFASVSLGWSQTLPQGAQITQGAVHVSQSGSQMAITQSTAKAVVNWQSFDIGPNAKVNVLQPNNQSVLLNRVLSDNPTQILGQLQANGQVVLVNPKGIVVGSDGSVSASAFTASTLNISDADFMAGKDRYTRDGSTGQVINKGRIEVAPGGYVALLGASVSNEGQIIAPQGGVALGAAETITVPMGRTGKIKLELTPASINASVANTPDGVIVAEGGQVYLQAAALGQAVASVLNSGSIDTSGVQAGGVHLLADGGRIQVDGRITANSSGQDDQGQARKGGDIVIGRDEETGVLAKATDVSGARLESVKGFVETSGDFLKTTGTRVKAGEWMLDPYNITIAASGATGTPYTSSYTSGADSIILASDISANLTAGTSVTLATGAGGTSTGNIAVNESINKTGGGDATLTLQAHGNITVAAGKTITSSTGKLNVVFNSDSDGANGGGIVFNTGSGITSNGGYITLGGGLSLNGTGYATADGVSTIQGISLNTATINAGGGPIAMNGKTAVTNYASSLSNIDGIYMTGGSITTSGSGTINLSGYNQNTDTQSKGFELASGTITGGSTGALTIVGDSRGVTSSTFDFLRGNLITGTVTSTGGNINITGYGGSGAQNDYGVDISGSVLAVGSGAINITGTAGAGGSGANVGVNTSGSGTISSVDGAITIAGTGGIGNGAQIRDHGVSIGGTNAVKSTGSGNITLTGTVTNNDNAYSDGVLVGGGGLSTNTGNIKLDGTALVNYQKAVNVKAAVRSTSGNLYIRSVGANITTTSTGTLSANNISIDNSNGTVDANTGVITSGSSGASFATGVGSRGVDISGSITAANNLNIYGNHTGAYTGVSISGATTTVSGKNVTIYGKSNADNGLLLSGATLSGAYINATGETNTAYTGFAWNGGQIKTIGTTGASTASVVKGISAASSTLANGYGALMMFADGSIHAATGTTLTLAGEATTLSTGQNIKERGILVQGGRTLTMSGDVTIDGSSKSSEGIAFGGTINMATVTGVTNKLTLKGTAAASSNASLNAVNFSGTITGDASNSSINLIGDAKNLSGTSYDNAVSVTGSITGNAANVNIQALSSGKITGTGAIGDTTYKNASVTFTQDGTSTYSGAINVANFTKAGSGALTLDSWVATTPVATNVSNAYTVKAGSLALSPGSTLAWLAPTSVNVENASTFSLNNSSNSRWNNTAFNFTGGVGGGFMNLAGNPIGAANTTNTFSTSGGATNTIIGGLNANGASANFNLTAASSGTALLDGNFAAISFTQNAQGGHGLGSSGAGGSAGIVNVTGGGALSVKDVFRATNFNINAGSVQFGDGTAATASSTAELQAVNVSIANGAKLTFNRAEAYTNASVITGSGSLIQAGTGVVTLTGNSSTFAGTTTVNAGKTLAIGTGGSLGAAGSTLSLTDTGSNLSFTNTSGTSTVASTISGPGTVTENGAGGMGVLLGNNTYTGVTTISSGSLQIGDGGSTGTLGTGSVIDNSSLVFNRSNTMTVANTISGTGTVSQVGAGTTILTANNSYAGTTTISAGTLQIGSGGTTGTLGVGDVSLSNNSNLNYVRSVITTIANNVAGTGNVSAAITGANSDLTVNRSINLTGGTVNLITDRNLSVTQAISTTNATSTALFLESGKSTSAGTATGGDITLSGSGALTVGAGGRATLMTGSVAGSTGLGIGAGFSRFNSDEIATNYTAPLAAGVYAIYRERPTITAALNNASKTYDGLAYTGGNGAGAFTGLVNGDTNAQASLIYAGTAQNAKNANSYAIDATGASALGYAVNYTPGTLTINKANLVLSGSRVYDGTTTFAGQYLLATGVNSETFSLTGSGDTSNLSSKNVQSGQTLSSVTGLSLGTSSNGGLSGNYNPLSTVGSSVGVTPRPAAVSATETHLTYSGGLQSQAAYTSTGLIASDAITVSGVSSGTNSGTYGSNLAVNGADASNYTITLNNANLVIGQANLSLTGMREYDGSKVFSGSALTATGVNGETFTVTGAGATDNLSTKNVQSNQPLATVTGLNLGTSSNGGLTGNYKPLSTAGSSVSVTPKAAAVTGTTTGLTYNGFTQTQNAATSSGFVASDDITVSGLATGKNAGSYTSALTVGGTDAGNYSVTVTNANLDIGKASLTARANSSVVTYNGFDQSVAGFSVTGLLGSDQITDLTGISANGATGKLAGSYTNTMQSGAQTNYTVNTVNGTLTINKKALIATGNSATVTYNGYDQTVGGFTVSGLVGADTITSLSSVSTTGATGKNAGSYANTVTAGTETNYTVSTVNGSLSIDKAPLTATGNGANLVYNGTAQSVSGYTLSGLKGADTAASITQVSASGATATNVGSATNTVTVGTETNYTVTPVNGTLNIAKANLSLSGTREYDGSKVFAGTALTATGVNGETFTVTGAGATDNLSTKNVQSNQLLSTVTGLGLGTSNNGGLSGNYNDLSVTGSSVSVTPKAAAVTGTATNVSYNGFTQTQNAPTSSGFVTGDNITISGLATGKNAGTYTSNLTTGGTDASNYTISVTNADLTIAHATLTVTANAVTKTYDGGLSASRTGTVGALAGAPAGETVDFAGTQAFLNKDAGTGKTVRASGVTIKDASGHDVTGNYTINYTDNTSSTINPAVLTITANNDARFVTQNDALTFNGVSYAGFVGGENETALGGTLAIRRSNAINDVAAGTYTGVLVPSGLTSNNYSIGFANGNYTIVPANQLLIKTSNAAVNYGTATSYSTTAQYLDSNSNLINTLTSTGSNGNYTFSDGAGGSVSVALKPYLGAALASSSSSGHTVVGNYDILDAAPVVTGGNFVGAPVFLGTLRVAPKAVTPSASGVSKTYDGTTSMANVVVDLTGKKTGDVLSINGSGAFSQKNAGTNLNYTISGVSLSGTDAANYYLSGGTNSFSGNDGVITAAPLVVSTSNVTKTYDRSTSATGAAVAVQGTQMFNGDSLSGGTYAFTNANVGTGNKTVTVSAVTVNDGNNGANYTVSYANNTTSTINPKALTASYAASNKTYNGNTTASVTGSSSDIISGDTVNFANTSAKFADKNVGIGKVVTVSGISLSGADAGNYSLQNTSATTNANITAKALTASFSTATRAYDGGTTASVTGSSTDMMSGDDLTYSTTSASFASADAAPNKLVSIVGIGLGGTDAGNYALQNTSASSTGTITQRDVRLTGLTAANKTYDGTVSATITAGAIATGVPNESLSMTGLGAFADKHAGSDKQVTVTDVTALTKRNGTGNWNNYKLTSTGSLSTTASIAQAALTVTANAVNKTYDGLSSASGTGTVGVLAGAGDSVSHNGSQSYLDKNVGIANKLVRASGVTIKDTGNVDTTANYLINYVDSLTGTIEQAPLQIGVGDVVKTYDGTLTAAGQAQVRSGTLFSGDSLSGGNFAFTDKNFGVGNKTVSVNGVTVGDGTNTGNYAVSYVNNTTSTINKAALTVTAIGAIKTYDATLTAPGSATVGSLAAGDSVNNAPSLAYLDANAGPNKTVRASGLTVKDAANADMTGNYSIAYQDVSTGVINKAPLSATLVGNVSKAYDTTTAAHLTGANYSLTGWVSTGEGVTVDQAVGSYASAAVADNTGTGSVSTQLQASNFLALGNTNLANYSLPTTASGNVGTITRAPLLIKVNDTSMFVTQAPNTALNNGFSYSGLKNGESAANVLSGALSRTYTGAANPAVGSYSGVYDLSAMPTAANYSITVEKGHLTVVPADKLLIHVASTNARYGDLTAGNAGTAASQVSAQYCLVASDCNGANIADLVMSKQSTRWVATDSSHSSISFDTAVDTTGRLSSGGFVNVGNYTFTTSGLSTTGTVNFNGVAINSGVLTVDPKTLSLSASGVTKVYDGTMALQGMALTPTGAMAGDNVHVASTGGSFAGKTAGNQNFVLTGLQLLGEDRLNYALAESTLSGTGTITPKPITVSGLRVQDKVYDGTTQASVVTSDAVFNGMVSGDQLSVTATGQFDTRHVGNNKSVTLSSTLGGSDLGNYSITSSDSSTARITPAHLMVTAADARKTYDGTTTAVGVGQVGVLAGASAGDVVAFGGALTFTDKNAGTGKTVTVTGVRLVDGSNTDVTGNYAITYNNSRNGIIDKASASLSALGQSVVYNGQTQSLNGTQGSGFVAGDALNFGGLPSGRNVGQYTSAMTVSGADAANYEVTLGSATLTITPKGASATARPEHLTYNGKTQVQSLPLLEGFFAGDDIRASGMASGQNAGVYGSKLSITGTDASNYSISYKQGDLTIDKAPLSFVDTTVLNKTYNGRTDATVLAGKLSGLANQETLTIDSVSGEFGDPEIGNRKFVQVVYGLSDGLNGGKISNYDWSPLTLLANITNPSSSAQRVPVPEANRPTERFSRIEYLGFGGLAGVGAATGRMQYAVREQNAQACTPRNLENCVCERLDDTALEICKPSPVSDTAGH